jgi:hypothetical protein
MAHENFLTDAGQHWYRLRLQATLTLSGKKLKLH